MEKLPQSCAGFVNCKYGCKYDVIDLKWLLLEERIDSSILKLVYNGINKENMPANLKFELKKPTRTSRNNSPIIIANNKNLKSHHSQKKQTKYLKNFQAILSRKYVLCRATVSKTSERNICLTELLQEF